MVCLANSDHHGDIGGFVLSQHARERQNSRAICMAALRCLLDYADQAKWVPGGCKQMALSRKRRDRLSALGVVAPAVLERAARLVAVVMPACGDRPALVVTVMTDQGRRRR